jgi:tetratricopeptide (TPR) repeat protein
LTDHRILRHGETADPSIQPERGSESELGIFDDADRRLPRGEVDRAKGIALMTGAWESKDPYLAARAQSYLLNVLGALGTDVGTYLSKVDDVSLLQELAAGYFLLDDLDGAEECWRRLLALHPQNETALLGIAKVAEKRQDIRVFGESLDKLALLIPTSEDVLSMRAKLQFYRGDLRGATQEAERLLEINPTRVEMRTWLAGAYQELGEIDKASQHREFLQKMGITDSPTIDHLKKPQTRGRNSE